MSVTSITITQELITSASNVLAAHSPLIFLAEAEEATSDFPEQLTVNVKTGGATVATLFAYPYSEAGTIRTYIFRADRVLRRFMLPFDYSYSAGISRVGYGAKEFEVEFKHEALTDSVTFIAYCGANQRGGSELIADPNDLFSKAYAWKGRETFIHYYSDNNETYPYTLEIGSNSVSATEQGVYRLGGVFNSVGVQQILANGEKTIDVTVLPDCEDAMYLAFLDPNKGIYKHWLFNRYYSIEGNAESIGSVINYPTKLSDPSTLPIGKRDSVRYILTADGLDADMMDYLVCINKSPRVYLQINDVWVLCEVEDGLIPYRRSKSQGGSLTISVRLPEQYNINML